MSPRRAYPMVRLMYCVRCGSHYHGDANNGRRRVRHARRPACPPSATFRAEPFEEQIALLFDKIHFEETDITEVLAAMRRAAPVTRMADRVDATEARAELQQRLAAGEISLQAFTRAWRQLDRPYPAEYGETDELRLRHARELLGKFGTLWRDRAIPDRLREEAIREIFERFDVDGPEIVTAHPRPNENAWLLGYAAARTGKLITQREVGLVGARGLAPP